MRSISLCLALLLPLVFVSPALSQEEKEGRRGFPGVIAAEGSHTVRAAPDRATVRLGVEEQAKTAKEAQSRVNEKMDRILASMKKLGVPQNRIATSRIDLSPVYSYPQRQGETMKLTGFRAANTLTVELALDGKGPAVGSVLDAAMEAGANSIDGVYFSLENDTPRQIEALDLAAKAAHAKAQAIARSMGVRLGRLLHAGEAGVSIPPPPRPMMMMKADAMESRAAGASVEPGELSLSATVQVRYAIESP